MTTCVIHYHGPPGMGDTPEEQRRLAAAWTAWCQQLGAGVTDGGHPFGRRATIAAEERYDGVADLTGYLIIEADDFDAAVDLARHCPSLADPAGRVEIYESLPF
ncbi:MAG: YciI family protein [Acidimicrobiales bacterium]